MDWVSRAVATAVRFNQPLTLHELLQISSSSQSVYGFCKCLGVALAQAQDCEKACALFDLVGFGLVFSRVKAFVDQFGNRFPDEFAALQKASFERWLARSLGKVEAVSVEPPSAEKEFAEFRSSVSAFLRATAAQIDEIVQEKRRLGRFHDVRPLISRMVGALESVGLIGEALFSYRQLVLIAAESKEGLASTSSGNRVKKYGDIFSIKDSAEMGELKVLDLHKHTAAEARIAVLGEVQQRVVGVTVSSSSDSPGGSSTSSGSRPNSSRFLVNVGKGLHCPQELVLKPALTEFCESTGFLRAATHLGTTALEDTLVIEIDAEKMLAKKF